MMANLPSGRLESVPSISNTGLDDIGPFEVVEGSTTRHTRGSQKCWATTFLA